MNMQTIMFPIEIIGKNLHCTISASSSSTTEVTLNLGVFFLYGSWGKRACSTKIYVKMEIFTISGFGSSRRMWLCSLIGVIRQPLASYMSQIWSWDFCKVTSMYFSMTQLLLHTFAHLTGPSFKVKAKLLPNKIFLGLV